MGVDCKRKGIFIGGNFCYALKESWAQIMDDFLWDMPYNRGKVYIYGGAL